MGYIIPARNVRTHKIGRQRIMGFPGPGYIQIAQKQYRPVNNKNILSNVQKEKGTNIWPWPKKNIETSYVISIRPNRFQGLKKRLSHWKSYVKLFPGTKGQGINIQMPKWKTKITNKQLRRGQIGCYDSHVRLWKHIAKTHKNSVLIMEDDAALFYTKELSQRFVYLFDQLQKKSIKWDIIYLGHYGFRDTGSQLAPGIHVAKKWQGLFCYIIKPSAASLLAKNAWPMREPCDVYVGRFINSGKLRVLKVEPRFCYVVTLNSDTTKIK